MVTIHHPLLEMRNIEKHVGNVVALSGVSFNVQAGECHCLLGDNGARKSTFIKTMSGVHPPSRGEMLVNGRPVAFGSPRAAMNAGIATAFQDLAMIPLMSVTRNFWMGREPTRGWSTFKRFDVGHATTVTISEMATMGIRLREPDQAVGTLSGGERQTVAIARVVYFGAKVLILDEPTSALGVRRMANVLATIDRVRRQGIGVVFITHNVRHAMAVGDRFTVLNRGRTLGTARRGEIRAEELQDLMAGGQAWRSWMDRRWALSERNAQSRVPCGAGASRKGLTMAASRPDRTTPPAVPRPADARGRKVTAKNVTERAGVSMWTVSSAFTDGAPVAPEVRDRIRDVAAQMGYTPSLLWRAARLRAAPGCSRWSSTNSAISTSCACPTKRLARCRRAATARCR
jgi:simple sugar transport system ATP-binding protein